MEVLAEHQHRIAYQHILVGIYDLCHPQVMLHFEWAYPWRYHLIVCDAETTQELRKDRVQLVIKVVRFYLRNLCPNGVLILKMYGWETLSDRGALGLLVKRVKFAYFHRCEGSTPGSEFYLVAYGHLNATHNPYTANVVQPSWRSWEEYGKFRQWLYGQFLMTITRPGMSLQICIDGPEFRRMTYWEPWLLPVALPKIFRTTGFTFQHELDLIYSKHPQYDAFHPEVSRNLYSAIVALVKHMKSLLLKTICISHGMQTLDDMSLQNDVRA
jgi:hypothetical protein